jgi:hypothetical protein
MQTAELSQSQVISPDAIKPKEVKSIILSSEDRAGIENINSKITSVPQNIVESSTDDVFCTLENGNPMNRVLRDEGSQVIAYLACEGEDGGEVYVKYLAAEPGSLTKLRTEVIKFITRAKKLNYTKISFNGFNDDLNLFLTRFGFVETGDGMAPLFELNLADTNIDILKSRQLRQYINFLEHDTSASEVWGDLSPEEQTHITRLLALTVKDKADPEINFLYGAISTLQKHDQDISKIKSIADLYAKSNNLLTATEKQENAKNYARWVLKYLESSNSLDLQDEAISELRSELEALMVKTNPSKYAQAIKAILEKYQIEATDEDGKEISFNQNFLYGLNPDSPKTFIVDIPNFGLTAYSLNNLKEMKRESAELDHCVGNSDFYIDKVREGKIKVISLRDKQGTPKYTLEYDIENKQLVQFKGKDNEVPEDMELVMETVKMLEKAGYSVLKIREDLDSDIVRDKQTGEFEVIESFDIEWIANNIKKYDFLFNINKIDFNCDDSEDTIRTICEESEINVDLTLVPDSIKSRIRRINGFLKDSSMASPDYSSLETCGDISMDNLTELTGFSKLKSCGNIGLNIKNLQGFENLEMCGAIIMNSLIELEGFPKLRDCKNIYMRNLEQLTGFDSLESVGRIEMNSLTYLKGFDKVQSCGPIFMNALTKLEGMNNLKICENIFMESLTSLNGLKNLETCSSILMDNLIEINGFDNLKTSGDISMNSVIEIEGFDKLVTCGDISMSRLAYLVGFNGLETAANIDMNSLIRLQGFDHLKSCDSIRMRKLNRLEGFQSLSSCGEVQMQDLVELNGFDSLATCRYINMNSLTTVEGLNNLEDCLMVDMKSLIDLKGLRKFDIRNKLSAPRLN